LQISLQNIVFARHAYPIFDRAGFHQPISVRDDPVPVTVDLAAAFAKLKPE
jgi:hypothetical protein